jgi:hypothetical protein
MEATMKRTLAFALLACTAFAAPAGAQGWGAPLAIGAYDGYYDYERPIPPRPVPGYGIGTAQTIVTTRRIIRTQPAYGLYGEPETVLTTRRVVAPRPVLDDDDVEITGSIVAPPYPPPSPYRRVLKNETIVGPGFRPADVMVTRRLTPAAPVIIEERRVETTRRILRPAPGEWFD